MSAMRERGASDALVCEFSCVRDWKMWRSIELAETEGFEPSIGLYKPITV